MSGFAAFAKVRSGGAGAVSSLQRMEAHRDAPKPFIDADLPFHATVARTAGNEILADLLQTIRSLLQVWTDHGLSSRGQAEDAFREHCAVHRTIADGEPAAAARAMREHMGTA